MTKTQPRIYDSLVEPVPGAFKARCNLQRWVPEKKLTSTELRAAREAGLPRRFVELDSERVDQGQHRKGRWEAHMLEHHSRKPGTYLAGASEAFSRSIRAGWRGPRLYADGQDVPKAATERLQQCPTCDLYGQLDTTASELWWAEHVRGCALAVPA